VSGEGDEPRRTYDIYKKERIRLLGYVYTASSETGLISFKYLRDEVMNNMIISTFAHTPTMVLSQHHSILISAILRVIKIVMINIEEL